MERGRVRCACRLQDRSSVGGALPRISSCRVGWSPVGARKEDVNEEEMGWCRAGNENRVGEGLVSSPTTVRKPPRESSSRSREGDMERTPTSRRASGVLLLRDRGRDEGRQKAVRVRAWEIVS